MCSVCGREEIGACEVIGEGSVCAASNAALASGSGGAGGGLESKHDPAVYGDW